MSLLAKIPFFFISSKFHFSGTNTNTIKGSIHYCLGNLVDTILFSEIEVNSGRIFTDAKLNSVIKIENLQGDQRR